MEVAQHMTQSSKIPTQLIEIDRPPRIQPLLPEGEIKIPSPPNKDKNRSQYILQMLLPGVTIVGYLLISFTGQGRNLLMVIPMGLAVVGSTLLSYYIFRREQREAYELEKGYEQTLLQFRQEMSISHEMQRLFYFHNYPEVELLERIAKKDQKEETRIGPRLWERRPTDIDFGSFRMGVGDRESTVVYTVQDTDNNQDPQLSEALRLAKESLVLKNVPISLSLRKQNHTSKLEQQKHMLPIHAIGIAGGRTSVTGYVSAILAEITVMHAPTDCHLYIIGLPSTENDWNWTKWLPHSNTEYGLFSGDRNCFQPPLSTEERNRIDRQPRMSPDLFWKIILRELDNRETRLADSRDNDVTIPFIVVVVDNIKSETSIQESWLNNVEKQATVSKILAHGVTLGAAIFFLEPDSAKIPSGCRAVITLDNAGKHIRFSYGEIGNNTPRYLGKATSLSPENALSIAKAIQNSAVRVGYGADLTKSVNFLEMHNVKTHQELEIQNRWAASRKPENADWLRARIGVMSGGEVRTLYFHQDHDGVHGIIAGTTGSGKSELLLTLICELAINYDPSILNFILVDYKGGAAFEPFRYLPHTVDIVTNLDKSSVERMFLAIKSELDYRSGLLARADVKHIVEYRRKGKSELFGSMPHLFIIVDEFAEMINENGEYKNRFESIARLGRAIGVNLILAAQRPIGAVTDQMRANMKFRICLRVETNDDSRELLGRSDARYLPSKLPGRAYIQTGGDSLSLIQVAHAGSDYTGDQQSDDDQPDIVILEVDPTTNVGTNKFTPTIVNVVVDETIRIARSDPKVVKQYKPWPNSLPDILPINLPIEAKYLHRKDGKTIPDNLKPNGVVILNNYPSGYSLGKWLNDPNTTWELQTNIWRLKHALSVHVGIIDLPEERQQRLMTIDLKEGPIVIFGSSGWGKTMMVVSLVLSLATLHKPSELQIYAMDFARGGLNIIGDLPHLSPKPIDVSEEVRVERLMRILLNIIQQRKDAIIQYGALPEYNAKNPDKVFPATLVIVENFAEFKEIYEDRIPQLTSIIRDGRMVGIYFILTADQTSSVPNKIYNLCTQRLTLKLADSGDYGSIVGRGITSFKEVPGRGMINIERSAHEFHIALPILSKDYKDGEVSIVNEQEKSRHDEDIKRIRTTINDNFQTISKHMSLAWEKLGGNRPEPVEYLTDHILLSDLQRSPEAAIIGLRDIDRTSATLDLIHSGSHGFVIGPPISGKTAVLRSFIVSMATQYTPEDVGLILVDSHQDLFSFNSSIGLSLRDIPHVMDTVYDRDGLRATVKRLEFEYDLTLRNQIKKLAQENTNDYLSSVLRSDDKPSPKHIIIVIDNYGDIEDFEAEQLFHELANLVRKYRRTGLHVLIAGGVEVLSNRNNLFKQVESSRHSLVLQSVETVQRLGGRVHSSFASGELPAGRGWIVTAGRTQLIQVALTNDEEIGAVHLDKMIQDIRQQNFSHQARWFYSGSIERLSKLLNPPKKDITDKPTETVEFDDEAFALAKTMLKELGLGEESL